MSKYRYLAMAAASALVVAASAGAANAVATHVLTEGSAGGTAVAPGAVLTAGLAKGSTVSYTLKSMKLTCKSSMLTATVSTNPVAKGTADESLTAQTVSHCTVNVKHVSIVSLKTLNLPFNVTVSDAAGFPVKVSGRSKSKPLAFSVLVQAGKLKIPCTYSAASITGHASNKGNVISIKNQKFKFTAGSHKYCLASANVSATFGPVKDSSVTGKPSVFVN